ncbi:DMT family transporter [Falsigemmobacter faecalis]|uniref:DMT family transporter n=1 Tax=Falsigemmobacter faecalis TaxID=2488730 RepID=A0A3P3DLU8_9RHOB|nr:DMT family transporter [Falsigemmobacter faecalis]RRH74716.1 DMT family transporter [Falsigemmobacter faecalis]
MSASDNRAGIWLMVVGVAAFTVQDGLSRYLAGQTTVWFTIMLRYWFFAAFVLLMAWRKPEGFRAAVSLRRPGLHLSRAVLHVAEILVIVLSFTLIGLINTHAVFQICPLLVAALAGPVLGERVSVSQWMAIGAGFCGILLILRPGSDLFSALALLPLLAAVLFALYTVLTRLATRQEGAFVSFFWSGILGAGLMTLGGIWFREPMPATQWGLTVANGAVAILANWLIIRCYTKAEANVVQPFAYLQLVFVTIMGILVFREPVEFMTLVGAGVIVLAGLSTLIRVRPGKIGN